MTYKEVIEEEELHLVPERGWWERTSIVSTIPPEIREEFYEIRKKFGLDVANLVLLTYRKWGAKTAKFLAQKIKAFSSFEELIAFLEKKFELFDAKSRKILSGLIFSYQYNFNFERLLSVLDNYEEKCPGVRALATSLFHCFASRGLFYYPDCIVVYALVKLGCRTSYGQRCRNTVAAMEKIVECFKRVGESS